MPDFRAQDPRYEFQVRETFGKQPFMRVLGAKLTSVAEGAVEIEVPLKADLLQHHGYLHGAVVAAAVDTACGCSALSLMPPDSTVLTVEYKINFVAPAAGERVVARGRVLKPGRRLTVCYGEALAVVDGQEKLVAALTATMMGLTDRPLAD